MIVNIAIPPMSTGERFSSILSRNLGLLPEDSASASSGKQLRIKQSRLSSSHEIGNHGSRFLVHRDMDGTPCWPLLMLRI
jgi:hypothetical protein